MSSSDALLADIGGTNVRFATLKCDGKIINEESWLTALYPDFASAVLAYGACVALKFPLRAAGVCAAGPLLGDAIELTNCAWEISKREIAASTGASKAVLVNDFAAVARALPVLPASDLVQVGGTHVVAGSPKVALGPGTGLGVASAVQGEGGSWAVAPGEGGHVDLAPTNDRELAIFFQLMRTYGHVSIERVLSGPGLENLYLAIAALDGVGLQAKPMAHDIAKGAHAGTDHIAMETVSIFTAWLGSVAGNLALTLGARGGVYIAGGIIKQWGSHFDAKLFRHRFEAKGRMRHFLEPIPCFIVTGENMAFRGLAELIS